MPTDRDGRGTGARAAGDRGRRVPPAAAAGSAGAAKGAPRGAAKGPAGAGAGAGAAKGAPKPVDPRLAAQDPTVAELAGPLAKVLARLPATQRRVLELRMGLADGHPHDLADTARALGLSLSEAREIEARAFEHIREVVPLQQLQRFLAR